MLERGEIKDPRIGFITFTGVEVTKDMRHAKVFFSSLGGARARSKAVAGLNSARGFIRTELGKRLRLKYVPEIEFTFDESVESSARIAKLIRETKEKSSGD